MLTVFHFCTKGLRPFSAGLNILHSLLIPLMTQRTNNSSFIADLTVTVLVMAMAAMTGAAAVGVDITNPSATHHHEDARRFSR